MNLRVFLVVAGIMNVLLFITQGTPLVTKVIFVVGYLVFVVLIATNSGLVAGLLFGAMTMAIAATPSLLFLKSSPSPGPNTVCETGIGGQLICREEH